jgi:hypothetical protein
LELCTLEAMRTQALSFVSVVHQKNKSSLSSFLVVDSHRF